MNIASRSRYVVLHHTGVASPHFDLMIESSAGSPLLTTFRCPRWPAEVGDAWQELPDHRAAYLDYEGPVSGDRGEVRRVESGTVETADLGVDPPTIRLRLLGVGATRDLVASHAFDADATSRWTVVMAH